MSPLARDRRPVHSTRGLKRIFDRDEFNAIAKWVGGKCASNPWDGLVVGDLAAGTPEVGEQFFKSLNPKRWMCLLGRMELLLDAEMKLQRAALKPSAAATCEFRRFR